MMIRRFAAAGAVLAISLGLSACGDKQDVVTHGETEGVYLDVGPLKYQVQISRLLNAGAIPEDRTFLSGVAGGGELRADEGWFAVFVRVENESDDPQRLAREFEIEDADHNVYKPVAIGAANPFRYAGGVVKDGGVIPSPDSVASQTSINGQELLFRVKVAALDESRPLVLKIRSPTDPKLAAEVDLDV